MKVSQKLLNLLGVTLLFVSTILSPISAVAQTQATQSSTSQITNSKSGASSEQSQSSSKKTKTKASTDQVQKNTESEKPSNTEDRIENKLGAPPALTPRSDFNLFSDALNTQGVQKVSVPLKIKKQLIGRELKDDEFEFDLVDDTSSSPTHNKTLQTAKNKANGEVNFEPIEFTKAGYYSYTIREKEGSLPGIIYDDRWVYVDVTVVEEKGKLKVSKVKYESFSLIHGDREENDTLINHYKPNKTSAKLEVEKVLTGRPLQKDEFEFDLKEKGKSEILQTVKNAADGKVSFKELEYTAAGTYRYTITEKAGDIPGVIYEPNLIDVTVKVEVKNGKLETTKITYNKSGEDTDKPIFNNHYIPSKTSAKLEVNKQLTGRKLKAKEFEFELREDGKSDVIETAKNTVDGKVQFKELEYTKAGEHHYTITEKKGKLDGVVYDTKEVKVTVKVTDDGKGKLSSSVTYEGGNKTFNNVFSPKAISVPLEVKKTLTGRNLQEDEFEFELYDAQNKRVVQTVKNKADGKIPFAPLTFDKPGTYNYQITEKTGTLPGVEYDKEPINVTIKVQKEEDGKLVYNAIYLTKDRKAVKRTFTNKYTVKEVEARFDVTKKLTGRELQADEFEFELKDNKDQVLQTKKNAQNGKVQFDAIKYQGVGTHKYTITEKNNGLSGVTYDTKTVKVTVEVIDNGQGQLVTKVTYEKNDQTFNNVYTPSKTSTKLEATKELTGRKLQANEFEFALIDNSPESPTLGETLQTVKNKADGKVNFEALEYTKADTYEYIIKEKKGSLPGITYDNNSIFVIVKVEEKGGKLEVTSVIYRKAGQETNKPTFNNAYAPAKTSAKLEATKELTGRKLKDQEFEFRLTGAQGEIEVVKNTADGKVSFKEIEYTAAGTYHYTIAEIVGDVPGIRYETDFITATVTVEDKAGKLEVTKIAYKKANKETSTPTFNNVYTPNKTSAKLEVNKQLTGRALQKDEFEFELREDGKSDVIETAKNTADGRVQFKELEYTKAGEHHYTITEKKGKLGGVAYDTREVKVTVKVTDDQGKLSTQVVYENENTFHNVYLSKKAFAQLEVNKVLTGRNLKAQEFEFELIGTEDNVQQVKKNNITGKVQFDTIEYDKAGEYHYTIKEKNNGLEGITYDTKEIKATVKVTDDGQGNLNAAVTYEGGKPTFTNTFTSKEVSVPLQVSKQLTGRELKADEFEFELRNSKNEIVQTVKNQADGTIPFKALTFTKEGLYHYQIVEKTGALPGIEYDKEPIKVTIKVQKEADGTLITNVIYLGKDEAGAQIAKRVFTNKYRSKETEARLSVTKKLIGRELKENEFEFELKDNQGQVLQSKKNAADGQVQFDVLKYKAIGTYKYTITEKNNGLGGVSYDSKVIQVTVEVTDNGQGQLVTKVSYENNDQTFTNSYATDKVQTTLAVRKELTGRELKENEFEFELKGTDDNVYQTKTNAQDGQVQFDAIEYKKAGTYHYTITEKDNKLAGVTYDKKVIKVVVTVTDDGTGKLIAQVSYENNDQTFKNTYLATETTAQLAANKVLAGRELKADEFEFDLLDSNGKVVDTAKNDKDGQIRFKELTFKAAGTYTYTIKEQTGSLGGIIYDTRSIKASIIVTDDGQGQLHASVAYENNQNTFTNTYSANRATATLSAKKVLAGRELKENEFEFELKDSQGQILQSKKNAADGSITFDTLTYDKAGEYRYTISEKNTQLSGVAYDKKEIKATVKVTDNGSGQLEASVSYDTPERAFHNSYTPDPGKVAFSISKKLTGRKLKAGEFEFELKDEKGKVLQSKKNAADGNIAFDTITYKKAGIYQYSITEKNTNISGVTYDKKVIKVTVTVRDTGSGQLETQVNYDKGDKTFENRYTPPKNGLPRTGTIVHMLASFIGLVILAVTIYFIKRRA